MSHRGGIFWSALNGILVTQRNGLFDDGLLTESRRQIFYRRAKPPGGGCLVDLTRRIMGSRRNLSVMRRDPGTGLRPFVPS